MTSIRSHQRGNYALECVTGFDGDRAKMRSLVLSCPIQIRRYGIGQTVAFFNGESRCQEGIELSRWIRDWLVGEYCQLLKTSGQENAALDLIHAILASERSHYKAVQSESLVLLEWIKLFVESHYPASGAENDRPPSPPPNQP